MLPDFPKVKNRANSILSRWITIQIPQIAPLMQDVGNFHQHEGMAGKIIRTDNSEASLDYPQSEFEFTLDREEMRRFSMQMIQEKLMGLAKAIGEAQSKRMMEVVSEAAASVGNTVDAGGELTKDKFLDIFRNIHMEFDPVTEKEKPGFKFVMHPDTAAKLIPKIKEWEKDPDFNAEYERIINQNREAWRDREANRKLVD